MMAAFIGRRHRPVCALAHEARAGNWGSNPARVRHASDGGLPARTRIEGGGEVPLRAEPRLRGVTPVQSDSQGGDHCELGRVVRGRSIIGGGQGKPWHEQALRLVSEVTIVVAVPALRGNISQVACSQRPCTRDTVRRRAGCPVIDQDELHVRPFLRRCHAHLRKRQSGVREPSVHFFGPVPVTRGVIIRPLEIATTICGRPPGGP
jgi:hypothetical protein